MVINYNNVYSIQHLLLKTGKKIQHNIRKTFSQQKNYVNP